MTRQPNTWPERIRRLRIALGKRRGKDRISQVELAVLIGCHPGSVEHWEAGRHAPEGLYRAAVEKLERSVA